MVRKWPGKKRGGQQIRPVKTPRKVDVMFPHPSVQILPSFSSQFKVLVGLMEPVSHSCFPHSGQGVVFQTGKMGYLITSSFWRHQAGSCIENNSWCFPRALHVPGILLIFPGSILLRWGGPVAKQMKPLPVSVEILWIYLDGIASFIRLDENHCPIACGIFFFHKNLKLSF